jgi:hypothetical protein
MSKKKKTYKKKYTSVRDDYRKGGRVKAQVGGLRKAPITGKKTDEMFIGREEEDKRVPTQPITKPTVEPKRPDVVQPTQQTATTPEEISALKGTSDSTPQRKVPKQQTTEREVPTRPNFISRKGSDQVFIGRADQETRTPQTAQAQTTQAQTTQASTAQRFTSPMSKEDFFKKYGDYDGPTVRGSAAAKRRNEFNASRQKAYEDYLRSFSTQSTTTPRTTTTTQQETTQEAKDRQQNFARLSAVAASRGQVPEAAQIPEAEQVGYERDAQGQLILDDQSYSFKRTTSYNYGPCYGG